MELDDDLEFHRREWRVQRAGRGALVVLVLLALAGAFGDGPLSNGRVASGTTTLEFQRILRWRTTREIRLATVATPGAGFDVSVLRRYAESVTLRVVQPEPEAVIDADELRTFRFPAMPGPVVVTFELTPSHPGWVETLVRAPGLETTIRQWILF